MIQRIQTVYLILAGVLTGILFFVPFAEIAGKEGHIYQFDVHGIYLEGVQKPEIVFSSFPVVILLIMNILMIFSAISLFKNRILQMKLSRICILIQLGLGGVIYFSAWSFANQLSGILSPANFIVIPVVAAVLIYLAFRSIKKDESLVRSIDRIR